MQEWIPQIPIVSGASGELSAPTVRITLRIAYLPNGTLPPDDPGDAAAPNPPVLFTDTVTLEDTISLTDRAHP